jgi:galactonate dehydratase
VRITAVETIVVNAKLRNWVFVKVVTDEPGLVGWGEATLEWKTQAVVGAVADLAPVVVGADPFRIEHLWQAMHRQQFFQGGVVTMSAISGIDQALWDIKAKSFGVPLYELLGGAVRDRVRMYDHLGGGDSSVVYGAATSDTFGAAARAIVEAGFTALKILAVPMSGPLTGHGDVARAAELMRVVREAVGDEIDVMVDLHGRTTPAMAIQYGHALAPFQPYFFEEPCQPGNPKHMADVARALPFPVATGERLISTQEFREHLEARACAVLQPDVCHVGGITGLRKIAAMAESCHVPLAPHNPLGPIATAVNQHVGFSTSNFLIQEVMRGDVPWRDDVVSGTLPIVDGHVGLPTEPGLGLTVDERAAAEHPYRPEPQILATLPDGSVADW